MPPATAQELYRKGWTLFHDADGNCIFPIQGESERDCIFWLCHGEARVAFQVPLNVLVEASKNT